MKNSTAFIIADTFDNAELEKILLEQGYTLGTKVYQALFFPSFFLGFSINVVINDEKIHFILLSLGANAKKIIYSLDKLGYEVKSLKSQANTLLDTSNLWMEHTVIDYNDAVNVPNELDALEVYEFKDVMSPTVDGMSLRGLYIDLGHKSSSFNIGLHPFQGKVPPYFTYFILLLKYANNYLKDDLSLICVKILLDYINTDI